MSIVSKPGRSISVQIALVPSEVRTLTQQFVQSVQTNKQISERLKPLKAAQKQNEQRALESFSEPVCERMRKDGKEVDMRIVDPLSNRRCRMACVSMRSFIWSHRDVFKRASVSSSDFSRQ